MTTQLETSKTLEKLRVALSARFPPQKVEEILVHYEIIRRDARLDRYESCLVNGGKFVEAILKCLHFLRTGDQVDSVRVDEEISLLEGTSSLNESERMTLPRTLRVIYEHRNKRGGAHNSSFDPTKMDCAFVVTASNWVMEELARLYLTNDPVAAEALVENLLVKDIPLIEEIDGDYLILKPALSARVQLEILLYQHYPDRCAVKDLIRWVHNHSEDNVRVSLRGMRTKNLAHENEGGWKLTESGVREAEVEIARIQDGSVGVKKRHTVRAKGVKRGRK
jgi:hypothetical protein